MIKSGARCKLILTLVTAVTVSIGLPISAMAVTTDNGDGQLLTEFASFSTASHDNSITSAPVAVVEEKPKQEVPDRKAVAPAAPQPPAAQPYAPQALEHFNCGAGFQRSGKLRQAVKEYLAALEADNRLEEAYSNLGIAYLGLEKTSEAIAAFKNALMLKPDRPITLNALGVALSSSGRLEEAKDVWVKAISLDPMSAPVYYNLGSVLEKEKNIQGALNAYFTAVQLDDKQAVAREHLKALMKGKNQTLQPISLLPRVAPANDAQSPRVARQPAVQQAPVQRIPKPAISEQTVQHGTDSVELTAFALPNNLMPQAPVTTAPVQTTPPAQVQFTSDKEDANRLFSTSDQISYAEPAANAPVEFSSFEGYDCKQGIAASSLLTNGQSFNRAVRTGAKPRVSNAAQPQAGAKSQLLASRPPVKVNVQPSARPAIVANEPQLRMIVRLPQPN